MLLDDSYDSILHKVMATCSRVEQRLNDKRKVYQSFSSSLQKKLDSKGMVPWHRFRNISVIIPEDIKFVAEIKFIIHKTICKFRRN